MRLSPFRSGGRFSAVPARAACARSSWRREAPMNVEAILKSKGRDVVTIAPEATINDAVLLLRRKRIGALVIGGAAGPEGILSERDIVRALADYGARIFDLPVSALMTRRVITCTPKDSVS